ncbi:hypothetical protein EBT16_04160 [bacterium]|nr:hypothetical protein [bacterium]
MPKVPVYDNLKVAPTSTPNADIGAPITPEASTISSRQMGQLGNAISSASQDILRIQLDASDVRATDAANKFRQELNKQMYGDPSNPSSGIINQRGVNAFQRLGPEGSRDLYAEAQENMDKAYSKIAENLSDDTQRGMFAVKAREYKDQHLSNVLKHQSAEWNNYQASVADDSIKTAAKTMGTNFNNFDVLRKEMSNIDDAVKKIANIKGTQGSIESESRDRKSKALLEAIKQSVYVKNLSNARSIMKEFKGSLEMDDFLSAETLVRSEEIKAISASIGKKFESMATQNFFPTPSARLANIIFDQKGMSQQEMYENKKTLDDRLKLFDGDIYATVASFNPKIGVDGAKLALEGASVARKTLQKSGDKLERETASQKTSVVDNLPDEYKKEVLDTVDKFHSGLGFERTPTVRDARAWVDAQLGPNATYDQKKAANQEVEARLSDLYQSKAQKQQNDVVAAVEALTRPEVNYDISKLPANISAPLNSNPEGFKKVLEIVKWYKEGSQDNINLFIELSDDNKLAKMSNDEFKTKLAQISPSNRQKFIEQRQKILSGQDNNTANSVDSAFIKSEFELYKATQGDPYTEGSKAQSNELYMLYTYIYKLQDAQGKKLIGSDLRNAIRNFFEEGYVKKKQNFFTSGYTEVNTKIQDMTSDEIPQDVKEKIKRSYLAQGKEEPNDAEVLRQYKLILLGLDAERRKAMINGK